MKNMFAMKTRRILVGTAVVTVFSGALTAIGGPSLGPGVDGARYATDAYPGFDTEDDNIKPERKEPRWFAFINGPNRTNAVEQFAYCQELVKERDYSKARKHLDALVREWPTAPEACQAQLQLAEVLRDNLADYEESFKELRYLLDFYSLQVDYQAVADKLYQLAGILQREGKEVMFVRFANTVDVRRAYEACVLRAPGAKWVPEAMLTIARLRVEEGKPAEAVKVFENLRNIYPDTEESTIAVAREAEVRMGMLRDFAYNRARCRDTINFMSLALTKCAEADRENIERYKKEAEGMIEEEAFAAAKFYDSTTRTRRSAISAYEKFLAEYPQSVHAEEVKARIEVLKGADK